MQTFSSQADITFGSLEAALASYQGIADAKRTAFQARLKNFHRLGFPPNLKSEKGRATRYSPADLLLMALAVELSQLGISPERLVRLLTANLVHVALAAGAAAEILKQYPEGFDSQSSDPEGHYLCLDPNALDGLMKPFDTSDPRDLFFHLTEADLSLRIVQFTGGVSARIALVNVTSVLDFIAPRDDLRGAFLSELVEWAEPLGFDAYQLIRSRTDGDP